MATAGPWTRLTPTLPTPLLEAITKKLQHPTMTPVQACAIPPLLKHKDVCVDAETGSGKTLSYLIPLACQLQKHNTASRAIRALVIAPTRELATQVHSVACQLFSALPGDVHPAMLIGGAGESGIPEVDDLRVVVATPGRLWAALVDGLRVSKLEMLILDEADRLLDMGFAVTVTDILTRLPKQRRTGIYSATLTGEVESLARAGLRNPIRVMVRGDMKGGRVPVSVKCWYNIVDQAEKLGKLVWLLRQKRGRFMVYFLTCASVEYARRLPWSDVMTRKVFALHGKMTQSKRERNLTGFANTEDGVLLCTDVAARGIDIAGVDWVVQMEPPQDPDAYIHRVGRTGRLGREGDAVIFLAQSEEAYVEFLKARKCVVNELQVETADFQDKVKKAVLEDRAVMEAGEGGFLSWLRAYKEHSCRYLLKLEEVDLGGVADFFGLVRMPRFHEFKKFRGKVGVRGEGIVVKDIAYKDKKREKRRQELIREAIQNRGQRKEALQAKSKKGKGKKKRKRNQEQEGVKESKLEPTQQSEEEDDFSAEAFQLRKLKRGKISHADFDAAFGLADPD